MFSMQHEVANYIDKNIMRKPVEGRAVKGNWRVYNIFVENISLGDLTMSSLAKSIHSQHPHEGKYGGKWDNSLNEIVSDVVS